MRTLDHTGKRPIAAFVDGPLGTVESLHAVRSNIAAVEPLFTRERNLSGNLLASPLPPEDSEY
jgi:hypothetical protein